MKEKRARLVRDKHIEQLKAQGQAPAWHIMGREEYLTALRAHFDESVAAYFTTNDIEELAEVLETVYTLAASHGVSVEELEAARKQKADTLGNYLYCISLDEE